jgi:hypothetical protein
VHDGPVRERILAEAAGNPLALLELPRGWSPAAFAGGFGLPDGVSVSAKVEESFRRRLGPLSHETRRLLLVAAAEPIGDAALVLAAAAQLGISTEAAEPATTAGLLEIRTQVRFRHPLVRSVVYKEASVAERRLVHGALARRRTRSRPRSPGLALPQPPPDRTKRRSSSSDPPVARRLGGVAAAPHFCSAPSS